MVARAESIVEHVRSGDSTAKLKAVRDIKNQVVGSRAKKLQYLKAGAVPHLVAILASEGNDPSLVVQAAATVGSLAYKLEDGVVAILASGGLPQLLRQLHSADARVVEATVRCLHFLLQSERVPREEVCGGATLQRLVELLACRGHGLAQPAARVLARTCTAPAQQDAAAAGGAVPALVQLLRSQEQGQQEAAVTALAALSHDNCRIAAQLARAQGAVPALHGLLQDRSAAIRQLACSCLVQMIYHNQLDGEPESQLRAVLLALVKLLGDQAEAGAGADSPAPVPTLLAMLVEACPQLRPVAADTDAVSRLAALLISPQQSHQRHQEGTLRALAWLMEDQEACRVKFMVSKPLPAIISALGGDRGEGMQAAAANCVRALSRSSRDVRLRLADAPLAAPLVALLQGGQPAVQAAAAAALCNLVLHFAAAKESVLAEGGLARLVHAVGSMEAELRLQGVWALQNLVYESELPLKTEFLAFMSWDTVKSLCNDVEPPIRERALNLVRNLVHGPTSHLQAVMKWAADEGNQGSGPANVLATLAKFLQPESSASDGQRREALFAVSNICAGDEEMQQAVMASAAPATFTAHLSSEDDEVREAATWCVINLSFDENHPSRPLQWVHELSRLGIPSALAALEGDPCTNVRRNVATAIEHFAKPEAMVCDD